MALLSKAFHSRRASEYHTTPCLESGNMAAVVFFPQIAPIDDAKNRQWTAQSSHALDRTCKT